MEMFVCNFGNMLTNVTAMAKPLGKLSQRAGCFDFADAVGWVAGDNDQNTYIHYLLCQEYEEEDESEPDEKEPDNIWQWRIFFVDIDAADGPEPFNSLKEFLDWYASAYDRVDWRRVETNVGDLHQKCIEQRNRELEEES